MDSYNGCYTVDELLYYENIRKLYTDSRKKEEGRKRIKERKKIIKQRREYVKLIKNNEEIQQGEI
jgi:predicted RNA-binding protein with PUA domain